MKAKRALWVVLLFSLTGIAPAQAENLVPVHFETNQGQTAAQVKFLSRGSRSTLFLTPSEAVLSLPVTGGRDVLRMKLAGACAHPALKGTEALAAKAGYFIGNDPAAWKTDITTFAGVRYESVYRGIDWVFHAGEKNALEYDFNIAPGADPKTIAMDFSGTKSVRVDKDGTLRIEMSEGVVVQPKPTVYQATKDGRREIAGSYVMKGDRRVGFQVAAYDRSLPLVIDPVLSYATYVGGNGDDAGLAIFRDAGGRLYVTGRNSSTDFPIEGGFQAAPGGLGDVLVAVLDPSKTGAAQLVYSSYLGDIGSDQGWAIAADAAGVIYVAGEAGSTSFPTKNGFQNVAPPLSNAFLTKLDPSKAGAAQLVYSTFLGGSQPDRAEALALDSSGRVFLAGFEESSDFPTVNAFDGTFGGDADAFVAEIDTNLSGTASLLYSTYLGGAGRDFATGVRVDSHGFIYAVGTSNSTDFPTANAFETDPGDADYDAFLVKLDPSKSPGSQLVYGTYLGGSGDDDANAVAVDEAGNAYVTGYQNSTDFPVRNEFQSDPGDANYDVFLSMVDTTKSGDASLIYSTYVGGAKDDSAYGVAVDASGRVDVTGYTFSTDYPTVDPLFGDPGDNNSDVFVSRLDPSKSGAASLLFSTYLGGSDDDEGFAVTTDASCKIYVAAYTKSANMPTANAFQDTFGGIADPYVAEIDQDGGPPAITSALTASGSVGKAFSYTITSDGTAPVGFTASALPAGLSLSGDTISGTPTAEDTTPVTLTVKDANCVGSKTLSVVIGPVGSGGSGGGCSLIR